MIRAFGLRDVPAVHALQRDGAWLNLFHYLLHRRSALSTALLAPVPWWGTGIATYVWETSHGVQGFVQLLQHAGDLEADILFVAPTLRNSPHGQMMWESLLTQCVKKATEKGLRRLFGSLPIGSAEIDVLIGLGFAVYTNETIYGLHGSVVAAPSSGSVLRNQRPEDAWWLRRLYSLYTPSPVQAAEGMSDREEPASIATPWWELTHQRSYMLERQGEIQGCVQTVSGRRGHWLVLYGDHSDSQCMTALLEQGRFSIGRTRWPIYCAVRDYQGGLPAVLQDHGFEPFAHRSRLVKHIAAREKVTELAAVPSLAIRNLS